MHGMVALVTGAGRGIGRATARRLVAEGATVVAIARNEAELRTLADEAAASGGPGTIEPARADVRDSAAMADLIASVEARHGRIDLAVNVAGAERVKPTVSVTDEDYDIQLDTNLRGVFHVVRGVLPGMMARRSGHIVSIASMAGVRGFAEDAVYCASKFGVVGFMDALDEEARACGIRVTTICPGAVDTSLVKWVADDDPVRAWFLQPDDVADAVLYTVRQPPRVVIGLMYVRPIAEPPYSPMLEPAVLTALR